jgi:hypothetical protein
LDTLASWSALVPAFGTAVAVLLVPGLVVGVALGLRGVALLGSAPLLSVGTVGSAAVVAPMVGQTWGIVPVAGLTVLLALLAAAGSWLLHAVGWRPPSRDEWPLVLGGLAAVAVGLVVAAAAFLPGLGRPDALSQTYDANFHYNAVRLAVDTGDASSLHLGQLISPGEESAFYPGAWHAVTSLVVELAEPEIVVAANGVSLALAGVVWPATCVVLVRQLVGRRWAPLLVAGALCGAFTALPMRILAFGVLFPNTTGYVLVPAALAAATVAFGLARDDAVGRPRAWAVLALGLVSLGLAHPNAVFTLVVLAVPVALQGIGRWSAAAWRRGRRVVVIVPWLLTAGVVVSAALLLATSEEWDRVSRFDWPARMTVAQAVGEVLLLAAVVGAAAWILSLLVLVGLVAAARTPDWRWLVASYLVAAGLYVLAAGSDGTLSGMLTGPWYNDAFRLAAMLPIVGAPLVVLGVTSTADAVQHRWGPAGDGTASWPRRTLTSPALLMLVGAALVLVVTRGGYAANREGYLAQSYALTPDHETSPLVTTGELSLFREVPGIVPAGVMVAGNPWTGSALVYALADRPVVFPHVEATWDPTRMVVAERLRDVATDPEVCQAVRDLGIGYALEGGEPLWPDDRAETYPGLDDLDRAQGFEQVDSQGPTRLYRITACAGAAPVT